MGALKKQNKKQKNYFVQVTTTNKVMSDDYVDMYYNRSMPQNVIHSFSTQP